MEQILLQNGIHLLWWPTPGRWCSYTGHETKYLLRQDLASKCFLQDVSPPITTIRKKGDERRQGKASILNT